MDMETLRVKIDEIDRELLALFVERMRAAEEIGRIKRSLSLPVRDEARESEKLLAIVSECPADLAGEARALWEKLFELSRARQSSAAAAEDE